MKKEKFSFFHIIFLNKDISFTIFFMSVLDAHPEGSVSQIFYLSPSFYFM